jgi:uncharacterized protein YqeY
MIMTIKDQVNHDIKEAMRARDQKKLTALRLISAAIKQIEVDERIEVDEARMLVILDKLAKQRTESLTIFTAQGRVDLAEQEQFELDLIRHYLPTPLSENEISRLIDEAFATTGASKMSDMGKVMAILKSQLQGRADMNTVSGIIKARLS